MYITLKESKLIAEGTWAFHFEKPQDFLFKAGQSIDITLIDPPETDEEGNTRAFSLTSAPFENELAIATRFRESAFKRVMKGLAPGSQVRLAGPFGSFTLHNAASRPAVFLAGGIGITPFMSILKQACHDRMPHALFLFYSNPRPELAAFLEELSELAANYPNFRLVCTMTRMETSNRPWTGERGRLEFNLVRKCLGEAERPVYYSAGPPAMVAAMRKMLNDAGVDDDDIRTEDFAGY